MSDERAREIAGPRVNPRLTKELGGGEWTTCNGCPQFRVHDFHYFYCRQLGDQSKPDAWNEGWQRIWSSPSYGPGEDAPCGLAVRRILEEGNNGNR